VNVWVSGGLQREPRPHMPLDGVVTFPFLHCSSLVGERKVHGYVLHRQIEEFITKPLPKETQFHKSNKLFSERCG
jgi:hypothetical protein